MVLLLLACGSSTRVYTSDPVVPLSGQRAGVELDTGLDYPEPEEVAPEEDPPPPAPALVINELATNNRSLYQDEGGNYSDYVEIYNPTTESVALSRIALRDGSGAMWLGGAGELAPGAWHVVVADDSRAENHAPFALDRDDDSLVLLVDGQNVDQLRVGGLDADLVWARYPDGGDWAVSIYPSAGTSNGDDPGESRDPSDRLFRLDQIGRMDIGLSAAAIDALRANRLTYVEGSASWEGLSFPSVGIRLKAYVGSARTIDQKAGFKVDLNRYDSEGELLGVETLTLNNMVQDPSYIHEAMAYMVFEAMGVPVPRVGYTRLYLNGSDMGLYLLVETVDENMIGRWFSNNDGNLYEGAYGVDLSPGYEFSFDCDECEDPDDRSDLTAVIDILQQSPTDAAVAELEKKVDLDEVLAIRATESVILHWDGYTTANNYRLYHDPVTDRFTMIPWGVDQTFVNAYYGPYSGYGQLWLWCLQNAACADRYDQKLLEAADAMDALNLQAEAARLIALIGNDISTDPRREFGLSTWQYYYDLTINTLNSYPASIRSQVAAH